MTRSTLLLALLAAVLLAGCTSVGEIDSWPLLYTSPENERQPGEAQSLGPIFDVQWKDSTTETDFRPLFSIRRYRNVPADQHIQWDVPFFAPAAVLSSLSRRPPPVAAPGQPAQSGTQVLALWPLFDYESSNALTRSFLLPIYYNVRTGTHPERTHTWALFPIYFGGNSDKYGRYQAVFPLGGTIKNVLGRDRVDFILFPGYMHTASGERHSYNVLWPIFNYAHGGGRDGWYVWPLIGRMHRQNDPPRWFFLWPFFWYTEPPKEGEQPTKGSAFFPILGWQDKNDVHTTNIIWPLYSHAYNRRNGRSDTVAPWPIFRTGYGPDYSRTAVWPIIGFFHDQYISRQYVLWPLFRFEQRKFDDSTMTGQSIFILYRAIARTWTDLDSQQLRSSYENVLWPLWYYKRDGEGNKYFTTLELGGVPDPQGRDRLYAPFWRIFENEKRVRPNNPVHGTFRSTKFLWQAFRYDRDSTSSFLRVFPAVTVRRENGRFQSFEVLMGVFGYVDHPDRRTYRTLFIPWSVRRSSE